jgi:anti-sigma factor ChrR (cupin superfamily)
VPRLNWTHPGWLHPRPGAPFAAPSMSWAWKGGDKADEHLQTFDSVVVATLMRHHCSRHPQGPSKEYE